MIQIQFPIGTCNRATTHGYTIMLFKLICCYFVSELLEEGGKRWRQPHVMRVSLIQILRWGRFKPEEGKENISLNKCCQKTFQQAADSRSSTGCSGFYLSIHGQCSVVCGRRFLQTTYEGVCGSSRRCSHLRNLCVKPDKTHGAIDCLTASSLSSP